MPISETESAYKPIIYGQQTPIGSGQKEPSITVENDVVCDKMEKGVTVVHNAGANWRVLKRPFENKNVNEQQYFDVQEN